jgi:hypothetical protein
MPLLGREQVVICYNMALDLIYLKGGELKEIFNKIN